MNLTKEAFENILGKGNEFSPFLKMFSTLPKTSLNFRFEFIVMSASAFNLDGSKFLSVDKD